MKDQTTDTTERTPMITDIRAFFVYLQCESVVQKIRSIDFSICPTTKIAENINANKIKEPHPFGWGSAYHGITERFRVKM